MDYRDEERVLRLEAKSDRLEADNARLREMLELVNDGTIHAGSGLMEGYRALLCGTRVGRDGMKYRTYDTPTEALEAAYAERKKEQAKAEKARDEERVREWDHPKYVVSK